MINGMDAEIYNKVITDYKSVSESQLITLINQYPYSLPLRYALDQLKADDAVHVSVSKLHMPHVYSLKQAFLSNLITDRESSEIESKHQVVTGELKFEIKDLGSSSLTLTENEERVSVYDDELMPYSFRWWLHKTRLEYAETYRPFASEPIRPKSQSDQTVNFKKLDDVVLDQQIRASILHYQEPEEKISKKEDIAVEDNWKLKKTDEILERFIKEEPQIKPPTAEKLNLENKARKSSEERFHLVTETLANIYIEQGFYNKALEIFKKLILKYPEKKAYFAKRISEIENINK